MADKEGSPCCLHHSCPCLYQLLSNMSALGLSLGQAGHMCMPVSFDKRATLCSQALPTDVQEQLKQGTHHSQNPIPPIRFQKPTCHPRSKGLIYHHLGWVSSMNRSAAVIKQQDPSTCTVSLSWTMSVFWQSLLASTPAHCSPSQTQFITHTI